MISRIPLRAALVVPLAVAVFVLSLTACASPADDSAAAGEPTVDISNDAVLFDVRTPEEFADGHLEGAELLDFNGGEFAVALPNLDPEAEYFVYCRSGNRSGQAMAMMQQAGIDNVTNLGSREEAAAATGIAIVQ